MAELRIVKIIVSEPEKVRDSNSISEDLWTDGGRSCGNTDSSGGMIRMEAIYDS